jgi:ATP-binding cassette subfamily B protein
MQPEILIFDEATSHLDTATERAIQRNLQERFADKTVILVAHRLSTIRSADTIYVMQDGRVAEHGTHNELLLQTGHYAALWHAQTQSERAPVQNLTATHNGRTNSIFSTTASFKGASK